MADTLTGALTAIDAEGVKHVIHSETEIGEVVGLQNELNKLIKAIGVSGGTITLTKTDGTTFAATIPNANTSTAGVMSAADKTKLDGIATNANNYSLPTASSSTLGGVKVGTNLSISNGVLNAVDTTYNNATASTAGLMSSSDKSKLDGIATNANNYSLPTASASTLGGVKTGSNITNSSGTISLTKDNVTSALGYTPPTTNTTYNNATTSTAGLMSTSDKSKLDGIANNANNYSLPTASATTLGGVKVGTNLSISNGVLNAVDTTYNNATASTAGLMSASDKSKLDGISSGAESYTLPTASATTLGGIKVGSNLSINNGVLSATNTTYNNATTSTAGLMSASDKSKLDGLSSGGGNYTLPTASATTLGGIKVGNGLAINNGVLSVTALPKATITVSDNDISVARHEEKTSTVVSNAAGGTISAVSNNPSIATASLKGNTLTITGVATGTTKIVISQTGTTTYSAPDSVILNVTVSKISTILNETDWATISEVSKAGNGDLYWDIGDAKEITLNGKIGDKFTANNLKLCVFILDFNHPMNGTAENNIIWGGFKSALTNGKDVALVDDGYGTDVKHDGTICFETNHWSAFYEGYWKGSDFRYDILGATSTAPSEYGKQHTDSCVGYDATAATLKSPKAYTLLAALPSELRSAMRLWTRWLDTVCNAPNLKADDDINTTVDAITLLLEPEIFSLRSAANPYEYNHNTQMAYYKNGNSTIRYKHNDVSSAVMWWEASVYSTNFLCYVDDDGSANNPAYHTYKALAIAPAFKT